MKSMQEAGTQGNVGRFSDCLAIGAVGTWGDSNSFIKQRTKRAETFITNDSANFCYAEIGIDEQVFGFFDA